MAKMHLFLGNVHHNKSKFVKGQEVPSELVDLMVAKGLAAPLPEPVKPVAAPEQPKAPSK